MHLAAACLRRRLCRGALALLHPSASAQAAADTRNAPFTTTATAFKARHPAHLTARLAEARDGAGPAKSL